ncbi:hypothetical protein Ahy_A04g017312 [Arachis hypogaea]|uniref:Uncharacterized protein n=1 Tax=Arachis hypogaea TaxID=3818 RepID=A0A445DAP8_ARAHY|nr:hypothetical protein Ahy_A04g017312 [Arachis hypogaea]
MSMCIHLRYLRLNRETLTVELASHYNLSYGIWRFKKLKHLKRMLCVTSKTIPPDTSGKDCLPNFQILQLVTLHYELDELNFSYCFLNNLGELTSLRVLKVTSRGMFSEDSLSLAAKSFPNLEVFHLKRMGVKEWILEKGAMSSLRHLIIKDCNWDELSEQLWSLTISTIMLILILTEQEKHPYMASF